VNGAWIFYELAGEGDAVVLIHGNGVHRREWDEQVSPLSEEFRVLRFDACGFGKSALPVEGRPHSHHEDVAALLRELGIERAHIVGHSMGAGIAADFALAHPEMTLSQARKKPLDWNQNRTRETAHVGKSLGGPVKPGLRSIDLPL